MEPATATTATKFEQLEAVAAAIGAGNHTVADIAAASMLPFDDTAGLIGVLRALGRAEFNPPLGRNDDRSSRSLRLELRGPSTPR